MEWLDSDGPATRTAEERTRRWFSDICTDLNVDHRCGTCGGILARGLPHQVDICIGPGDRTNCVRTHIGSECREVRRAWGIGTAFAVLALTSILLALLLLGAR